MPLHTKLKGALPLALLLCCAIVQAQVSKQGDAGKIFEHLLRLQNTATVMYVAAHPDDENTRLISWLSNHEHVNTVYLSLTRGDGGQNLIGTEKGPMLGLLRTQELLQARKIDGGRQFFSRANDFGFSKTATETRSIWEEEEIMGDVVWALRKFRPDVIINRFDADTNGKTHGHHTFSAIASLEAFDLAADPAQFPEQLDYVDTWQPKRLFFNTSWWFYGSQEAFEEADKSDMVAVDVGEYFPLLGKSNNEIAAMSRSMHRCQGFGTEAVRGGQPEYLRFLKGTPPATVNGKMGDILDGIDLTYHRFTGKHEIDQKIQSIIDGYDFTVPSKSILALLELRQLMENTLKDRTLKERKLGELTQIIQWCAGLYIEATSGSETVVPGDSLDLNIEIVNRSNSNVKLVSAKYLPTGQLLMSEKELGNNVLTEHSQKMKIRDDAQPSSPYWLEQKNIGMYIVPDQEMRGQAETPVHQQVGFEFDIEGNRLGWVENITYKYADPAIGEIYQPLVVAPKVTVNLGEPVYISCNGTVLDISVELRGNSPDVVGEVGLEVGKGWTITPPGQPFSIAMAGDRQIINFKAIPPKGESVATLHAFATSGGKRYGKSLTVVDYEHIPKQTAFLEAEAVIEHLNIDIPAMEVGYISGAGDLVPQSLRQLGIKVEEIDINAAQPADLKKYPAIVVGIRTFNTKDEMKFFAGKLWEYAKNGGNVIVQYNTHRGLKAEVSPLPLTISRDRITEEDAKLTVLDPAHPVFNSPNKIGDKDFDGWVQERGLYFASEWDGKFTPLLKGHDVDEEDKSGMLLIAPYGKGNYVYTGLSFFRQLPAGVPGAYRLFVNLLSLKQH